MASQSGYNIGAEGQGQGNIPPDLRSRDLPSKRLLGKGLASIGYETEWKGRRYARKDFVGVGSDIFRVEAGDLIDLKDHPNVVKTHGLTVDKLSCSLVLEYMDDKLSGLLQKRRDQLKGGSEPSRTLPFELQEALALMLQIARGMEHLHEQGILHGDLKTRNILVTYVNNGDKNRSVKAVKVADFGLVKTKRNSMSYVSRQARKLDMVRWKAPEILEMLLFQASFSESDCDSDEESTGSTVGSGSGDVYSFAVTCFHILTGEEPYPKRNWREWVVDIVSGKLRPKLPPDPSCPKMLRELLMSCWGMDPDTRPTFSYIRKNLEHMHTLRTNPESSRQRDIRTQDRSNVSISKDDPILQFNHKIFLSHSGHQKDFVEELCGDLEERHRFPFFDGHPSSLPKGERFPEIVNQICNIIPSDIEWDDSHVQGGSYLCQVIRDKLQQVQASEKAGVCLVGVYGVGGLGKTTLCKILCNKLCEEFEGKVGHVELGSRSSGELLKEVLKVITISDRYFLELLNEDQCWNVLRSAARKQKMFLAIDNVWPQSIKEAKKYLQAGFHKESVVMVTSRALETLTSLGIGRSQCFEMPSLGEEDAKNLFLHHASNGIQFPSHDENKRAIEQCVARGYFLKGGSDRSGHYHPLVLKALGEHLGYAGESPAEWVQALPEVRDFNYLLHEENPVFSILRSSFDCLWPVYQTLFMDLILFRPAPSFRLDFESVMGLMDWLTLVYDQDIQVIETWLQHLKRSGLLEEVDMASQSVYVHDLYREFARLEASGKLNESAEFGSRTWVYYEGTSPAELEMTPDPSCWQNLIRVGIVGFDYPRYGRSAVDSLQGIDWMNCSNVVVLKLGGLDKLRGDLNLKGLKCLRSLELFGIGAVDTLDGLEDLNNLTFFRWSQNMYLQKSPGTRMGQLPASLKVLCLDHDVLLRSDVFARCFKLSTVELSNCHAECLDFSNCTSVERVYLRRCGALETVDFTNCTSLEWAELFALKSLKIVSGLSAASMSCLQSLKIHHCYELVEVPGLSDLVGLRSLHLEGNSNFKKLLNLKKLTRLEVLDISFSRFEEVSGLDCLRQLRTLRWMGYKQSASPFSQLPNLSGLERLDSIEFSCSKRLRSLEGVFWDLPALRSLKLAGCRSLSRLPDLSGSWNLEELDLRDSGIEIGEVDMHMLASLPLLHPVLVGTSSLSDQLRLDVVRRKVLKRVTRVPLLESWPEWTEWEERDLSVLPIKFSRIEWAASPDNSPDKSGKED